MFVSIGSKNNNNSGMLVEKTYYSTENQKEFDFVNNLYNGCLIFINGFKNNVNYSISNTKVVFQTGFSEGTEITIISII